MTDFQPDFTPDNLAAAGRLGYAEDRGYEWPTDPRTLTALEHWRSLKFGVIMHWGLYATIGQDGSWSLCRENIGAFMEPPASWSGTEDEYEAFYKELRKNFTGEDYRPEEWAAMCAKAGMKYLVFTSKHHDGFAMYNTAESDYKVTAADVPLGRDILRETFDAFRAEGLETGVYFSKADWAHPGYWKAGGNTVNRLHNYNIDEDPQAWDGFVQFTQRQIEELLTNYGDISVLWLDAGWVNEPDEPIGIDHIAQRARELQPDILVVDREVHGPNENYRTPEQEIPSETLDYPWESCITLTPGWCSMRPDDATRPAHEVIATLARIVSRGGNYLLGIGPDATGAISRNIVTTLEQVGGWMDVNGEAIYGTVPGGEDADLLDDGGSGYEWHFTRTDSTIFALALIGDADGTAGFDLKVSTTTPVRSARVLGTDVVIPVENNDGEITVAVPRTTARLALVLALELATEPVTL
ncbi:alpha-L-fucosidase [Pseudarthrobacter sp. J1763]|uniref:alpha-L-fucosidase n=1 Tax=Pseudarthrobacter sp. J1763 TaxID=3420445 RepID=UPI003D28BA9A